MGHPSVGKARWDVFVDTLSRGGTVTEACEAANVGRSTAYERRQQDAEFAAAWQAAYDAGTDRLEKVAFERASSGESDRLLEFLLRGRRPERYGNRVDVNARVAAVPAEELERLRRAGERDPDAVERVVSALLEEGDAG